MPKIRPDPSLWRVAAPQLCAILTGNFSSFQGAHPTMKNPLENLHLTAMALYAEAGARGGYEAFRF